MEKQAETDLLNIKEAAAFLNVNTETLRRWDRKGILKATRVGKRQNIGDRRYNLKDLELLKNRGEKVPRAGGSVKDKLQTQPQTLNLTPKQKNILKYLTASDIQAANAYLGGLLIFQTKNSPDWIAQAAHSFREMTNILLRRIAPPKATTQEVDIKTLITKLNEGTIDPATKDSILTILSDRKSDGNNVKTVRDEISKAGLDEKTALEIARAWVRTHYWFTQVSHHGFVPSEEQFQRNLTLLEDNLIAHTGQFYEAMNELDSIIQTEVPDEEVLNRLKALIKKGSHYQYFFNTINSPTWLTYLTNDPVFNFKVPPKPIRTEDGSIRFPVWIEMQYLIRIADRAPEEVCKIILETEPTDNIWVHSDYIEAALKMPTDTASKLLDKAYKEKWFKSPYHSRASYEGVELLEKFIQEVNEDAALRLVTLLLGITKIELNDSAFREKNGIKRYEAKSYFDEWEFGQILEKHIPKLVEMMPLKVISLLVKILETIIVIEAGKKDYSNDMFMKLHRPTIEDSGLNWHHEDIKSMLIVSLRNALEAIAENHRDLIKHAIAELEHPEGTYPVMKRIKLHTFRKYPDLFAQEIQEVLKNKENFYSDEINHEYQILLKDNYLKLPKAIQQDILQWLKDGPADVESETHKEYWQVQKLFGIHQYLPQEWKEKYINLIKKYKPDKSEGAVVTGTWVGPESPLTEEKLIEMGPNKVIAFIIKWKKPKNNIFGPSPEGLGRSLESLVEKNSATYMSKGLELYEKRAKPVYIYHFMEGIRKTLTNKVEVDWEQLILLSEKVTAPKGLYKYIKDGERYDPDWNSVKRAISDLIEDSLKKGNTNPPFEYRERIWKLINILIEEEEPNRQYEIKYGGRNMNPVTLALNTTRGKAFHALVQYSLWVSRNLYPDEKKTILPTEVKKALEFHLNNKKDPSQTTRSIFGLYFPTLLYLDKNWTHKNTNKIFEHLKSPLGLVAWEAYVGYATYWIPAVKELSDQYADAVTLLKPEKKESEIENRLAEHLMAAYWRGDLSVEDNTIKTFFANAHPTVAGHAHWFLWRSMDETKLKKESKEWERMKALWKFRIEKGALKDNADEFTHFADWLSCAPEDINQLGGLIKATIPALKRSLDVGYLVTYINKNKDINPEKAAEFLYDVISLNTEDVRYRIHDNEIKEILGYCINSGNEKAKEFAEKTIHLFGDRGNNAFRTLLSS